MFSLVSNLTFRFPIMKIQIIVGHFANWIANANPDYALTSSVVVPILGQCA